MPPPGICRGSSCMGRRGKPSLRTHTGQRSIFCSWGRQGCKVSSCIGVPESCSRRGKLLHPAQSTTPVLILCYHVHVSIQSFNSSLQNEYHPKISYNNQTKTLQSLYFSIKFTQDFLDEEVMSLILICLSRQFSSTKLPILSCQAPISGLPS